MILLSAFGAEPDLHNMRGFMRQWEQAEKMLTGEDYAVLGNLDEKDMGPFLFWLLNERASLCASFLFCPSSPSENSDDFSPPLCGMHELRPRCLWTHSMACDSRSTIGIRYSPW